MSDSATPWTIQSMEFVRPELERVAFSVSRGSSEPRDRTQISSIAGGFFIRKNATKSCKLSPRASVWMQQLSMTMKKLILLFKMKLLTLLLIYILENSWKITSVQSLSRVWLFANPRTAACLAFLSITNSQSWLRLMSINSVMPSNRLLLWRPLLLLPSIFPNI